VKLFATRPLWHGQQPRSRLLRPARSAAGEGGGELAAGADAGLAVGGRQVQLDGFGRLRRADREHNPELF
jgi:hypothetical protein